MSFLFRSLTATFCLSWYAHIVAILHRKTYLIQPVIQLSKFNRAPQGVVSGVRGEYPKKKIIFRLLLLTNQLANYYGVWQKNFFSTLTFNCWLFWGNGQIIFLFRLKTACYQGFISSLVPNGVWVCTPPFLKKFCIRKQKTAENPLFTGFFSWKNILNFFEIHRKTNENLL